ncbi:magnesium transporter [Solimonas aquatica]|uniref:Magnesium transporter MgtE n=1 Tax=Solimonas aquatica TaxID=489703 RepID=A0A1H9GNR1_9GAMM|nr:magnesium transporter [Solimonas aquatica]SEQ51767.1 magnesium transporter [Solimonas aquatica]
MPESTDTPHHRHLEHARAQVIELLSRQAIERDLLSRSENRKSDVVAQLVVRQHQAALAQRLMRFHPADIAFVLENLAPEAREMAWALVRGERRGAVLLEASDNVRRSLVESMAPEEISAVMRTLDSDDIADLVSSLPDEQRAAVLEHVDRADQAEVRSVLSFPEDSVGAMMDLDFIAVREDASLEAVQRLLRRKKPLPPHTNELIVVDRNNSLRGVLPLDRLLLEEPEDEVSKVMLPEPTFFYTDDRDRDAVDAFEKYDLISAPVVNLHRQVVGRITVDAVIDEINERAQSEGLRQVGLSEDDEDLFTSPVTSARKRWPWVALNLLTAFVASRVIDAFEPVIAQLVALATLMPIVASIGGNTGNQTMALVIRGLSLNQMGPQQLRKMLLREVLIAGINGTVWGSALGGVTFLLYHDWKLAGVIGSAMLLELLLAATAGLLIPVLLQRFGRDPIMGSSVMLTATTDSMGFFIFLGLASLILIP